MKMFDVVYQFTRRYEGENKEEVMKYAEEKLEYLAGSNDGAEAVMESEIVDAVEYIYSD